MKFSMSKGLKVCVGKHLEHVAKCMGHQVEYAAGWFTTLKRWALPQFLAAFNEVPSPPNVTYIGTVSMLPRPLEQ